MRPHRFAIVTPTYRRRHFLRRFVGRVRAQTHPHLTFVLVHDGPSPETAALARRLFEDDPRCVYLETPERANDWGVSPRLAALAHLAGQESPPDYVLLWDDDNRMHRGALAAIADTLGDQRPDLLMVGLRRDYRVVPVETATGELSSVDTGNIVASFELFRSQYPRVPTAGGDLYHQDLYFYRLCVEQSPAPKIMRALDVIVGRYDGLRRLYSLRLALRIPPMTALYKHAWYRRLRGFLRG
jgi:glycosyltransferase involved in cell wall biosynthesis